MDLAGGGEASGAVAELIEASFGSQSVFRQEFIGGAGELFGSGWVWLDGERARIVATANAGARLVDTGAPLLVIDTWEHAYYLDYRHRRLDYISAVMAHRVNWRFANRNLALALDRASRAQSRWNAAAAAAATDIPLREDAR